MREILMPRLSDSMEEGLILGWLVDSGSEVAEGQDIVEIETDKANMTYEADENGLVHHVAREGDSLPVGAPIAHLLDPGEEPTTGGRTGDSPSAPVAQYDGEAGGELSHRSSPLTSFPQPGEAEKGSAPGRQRASPLARRMARDMGVEIEGLEGSGPGGRVVKRDIESLGDHTADAPEPDASPGDLSDATGVETAKGRTETVRLSRLQQTVVRRMSESKATVPHFYLTAEVDMSKCFEARSGLKRRGPAGGVVPSFNDMVVKACATALREFPRANGSYRQDGQIELHSRINVGVAVAAEEALVVPVIQDADRKGLAEIASSTRDLAARVRDGSITPPELSGGTFTVSNLGMYRITSFDAVINAPQAAILAVGAIEDRPVVREGQVQAAKVMSATLSCDHRILYGAEGARFLDRINGILQEPISLAL